jgi:hypothetical protein
LAKYLNKKSWTLGGDKGYLEKKWSTSITNLGFTSLIELLFREGLQVALLNNRLVRPIPMGTAGTSLRLTPLQFVPENLIEPLATDFDDSLGELVSHFVDVKVMVRGQKILGEFDLGRVNLDLGGQGLVLGLFSLHDLVSLNQRLAK